MSSKHDGWGGSLDAHRIIFERGIQLSSARNSVKMPSRASMNDVTSIYGVKPIMITNDPGWTGSLEPNIDCLFTLDAETYVDIRVSTLNRSESISFGEKNMAHPETSKVRWTHAKTCLRYERSDCIKVGRTGGTQLRTIVIASSIMRRSFWAWIRLSYEGSPTEHGQCEC